MIRRKQVVVYLFPTIIETIIIKRRDLPSMRWYCTDVKLQCERSLFHSTWKSISLSVALVYRKVPSSVFQQLLFSCRNFKYTLFSFEMFWDNAAQTQDYTFSLTGCCNKNILYPLWYQGTRIDFVECCVLKIDRRMRKYHPLGLYICILLQFTWCM